MHFEVVQGDIAKQTAHALVNTTDANFRMKCGVSKSLRREANGPIVEEAAQQKPIQCGDVIVTDAYELAAPYLLHAVPISEDGSATEDGIRTAVRTALQRADEMDCRSLVIPLLGCGGGGYDLEAGATLVCEEIWRFDATSLADVRVIARTSDSFEQLKVAARDIKTVQTHP